MSKPQKALLDIAQCQTVRTYPRGLKLSRKFLEKFPNHPEGTAWQAFFTYMKDSSQGPAAIDMMKQALRLDMKSARIWRVAGLLYREMQDLPRAAQSFKQSIKFDPSDAMVLNELCNLYLMEKHYQQYLTDSKVLLDRNPSSYTIVRYVFGLFLVKNWAKANSILALFQKSWKQVSEEEELLFRSETCLLVAGLFLRLEKWQECLDYLKDNAGVIRDRELSREFEIRARRALGQDVKDILLELLHVYPENGDYFGILEEIVPADQIIDELLAIRSSHRSSYAHVRALELMDIEDPRFQPLLEEHLRPLLVKGAPSAYMTVRAMSPEKLALAAEMAVRVTVPITSIPIVKLFTALHAGYSGDYDRALEELRAGLQHTPTCIELIAWRTRLSARAGRIANAIAAGRELYEADPADRNSNLLFVKVLFLGGYRQEAERQAQEFAGQEDGKELIYQSQFNVFYLQSAFAAVRAGDIDFAKVLYNGILGHFDAYRKGELGYLNWAWKRPRALMEIIEELDRIEKNPIFGKAVEMLLALALQAGEIQQAKPIAVKGIECGEPIAIAYSAVALAKAGATIPALRGYLKLSGLPAAYLAAPTIARMMAEITTAPPVIQEVANEEYRPITEPPRTCEELLADGKGKIIDGDNTGIDSILKAVDDFSLSFRNALNLYVYATAIAGKPEVAERVGARIRAKYPQYELDPEHTEDPEYKPSMA
jgi:tetratricopeptide (TPR) repeat protein